MRNLFIVAVLTALATLSAAAAAPNAKPNVVLIVVDDAALSLDEVFVSQVSV